MIPDFRFAGQALHIIFDAGADFPAKLAEHASTSDPEFQPHPSPQSDGRILLVSQTGSTTVNVADDNAIAQTRYYAGYEQPGSWDLRDAYTTRKLRALVGLLSRAGARCQFVSSTTVVRWVIPDGLRAQALAACVEHFRLASINAETVVDFAVRVGAPAGEYGFLNVMVTWFQTRSIEMIVPPSPRAGLTLKVRDWDGQLRDEGLELRFEANNKRGLYREKRSWSEEELVGTIMSAHQRAREGFASATDFLVRA